MQIDNFFVQTCFLNLVARYTYSSFEDSANYAVSWNHASRNFCEIASRNRRLFRVSVHATLQRRLRREKYIAQGPAAKIKQKSGRCAQRTGNCSAFHEHEAIRVERLALRQIARVLPAWKRCVALGPAIIVPGKLARLSSTVYEGTHSHG